MTWTLILKTMSEETFTYEEQKQLFSSDKRKSSICILNETLLQKNYIVICLTILLHP